MEKVQNITDFNDYLKTLLNKNESSDLEFKSAAGGFPGNFWDTYSAFANTNGGTIVLGVQEKSGKFYIDNLSEPQIEKYRKDFWNNVNNPSTVNRNLMHNEDVVVGNYNGFAFMLFFVPRAPREMRPVYRTTDPYKGTFKRNYEGDYKCTEQEVRRMFADADDAHPADSRILKNYSLNDIDKESLNRYRQLFKLSSPDHPWLSLDDIELLRMLGGYRKDRQTGEEGFTVAGLLMFGTTQSITDVECAPHFFPDYQEHLTENEDTRWTNRICADGTWEANLFNFYQRVLPRLQSALPKPFVLENNIRREETSAHIAVREALINLCVHADYTINASLVVRYELHRLIFSNPGTLLVSKSQYYEGGESVCRNKSLQKMFSMLGVAEKAGSGTDKIMKGWRELNWQLPQIEERQQPDKVVLTMPIMATSDPNVATSDPNVATSETNMATSEANMATSEANMATSDKTKRLSKEVVTQMILQLAHNAGEVGFKKSEAFKALEKVFPNQKDNTAKQYYLSRILGKLHKDGLLKRVGKIWRITEDGISKIRT